jgi:hypothetical protein
LRYTFFVLSPAHKKEAGVIFMFEPHSTYRSHLRVMGGNGGSFLMRNRVILMVSLFLLVLFFSCATGPQESDFTPGADPDPGKLRPELGGNAKAAEQDSGMGVDAAGGVQGPDYSALEMQVRFYPRELSSGAVYYQGFVLCL